MEDTLDLSGIIKSIKATGLSNISLASDTNMGELIPFKNKVMNLISEGGFPYGHIHEFFGKSQTGKCVGGETLLYTDKGMIPIEDLFSPLLQRADPMRTHIFRLQTLPIHTLLEPDSWYKLKEPLQVLNAEGKFETCTRIYYGGKQLTRVCYTVHGLHLSGTQEHKIELQKRVNKQIKDFPLQDVAPLIKDNKFKYGTPITIGKRVYGSYCKLTDFQEYIISLDPDVAYAFGKFSMSLVVTNYFGPKLIRNKKVIFEEGLKILQNKYPFINYDDNNFIRWLLFNEVIIATSDTVEIPSCIKQAPREIVLAYLAGVLSSGEIEQGTIKIRTKAFHLAHQVLTALMNEGCFPMLTVNTKANNYTLKVDINTLGEICDYIVHYSSEYEEIKQIEQLNLSTPRIEFDLLRKVYRSTIEVPVYDIEMKTTHKYYAGGFNAHNSYFMYELLAQSQKLYKPTFGIIIDKEGAYNKAWGQQIGINNKMTLYVPPYSVATPSDVVEYVDKAYNIIMKKYANLNPYIFVIIDSMAAFTAGVARGKANMGKSAKNWHESFRDLGNFIGDHLMIIVSNHVTINPNVMFGDPSTKTSGTAIDFYRTCGIALEEKRLIKNVNKNNEVVGKYLQVLVDKTRLGPSYKQANIPFYFKGGVQELGGYIRFLVSRGYLEPKNKAEFKSHKSKTCIYVKDGVAHTITEGKEEEVLASFPELNFDTYPEFKGE